MDRGSYDGFSRRVVVVVHVCLPSGGPRDGPPGRDGWDGPPGRDGWDGPGRDQGTGLDVSVGTAASMGRAPPGAVG